MSYYGQNLYQADPSELRIPRVERWKWTPVQGELLNNLKSVQWEQPVWDTRKPKNPFLLVVAEPDIETGALLHLLAERRIPFLAIAAPGLAQAGLSWRLGGSGMSSTPSLTLAGKVLDPKLIQACYWRWAQNSGPSSGPVKDPRFAAAFDARVVESRWKTQLTNWALGLNSSCLRLPAPVDRLTSHVQNRFSDLALAQSLGFLVPETLVTQDAAEIKKFFRRQKSGLVLREATPTQHLLAPKTLRIRKLKLGELPKKNLMAPAAFQAVIESRTHLRAVVVGTWVGCARLEILGSDKELDWRRLPVSTIEHTEFTLPKKIASALIKFAKLNGMELATFDLILTSNQQIYFLEMNRPGRWFYLELFAGLKIRNALADLIAHQLK